MRIVGGQYGGRRLVAPRGDRTRPTADRVREALFSVLFDVTGARVLDLFAGSGAVGLEAISRGARHATLVENGRAALRAIEENVKALRTEDVTVVARDFDAALTKFERDEERFDLIFADPPYDLAKQVLPRVLATSARSADARIVLEFRAADEPPAAPEGLERSKIKRYGEAALAFYEAVE